MSTKNSNNKCFSHETFELHFYTWTLAADDLFNKSAVSNSMMHRVAIEFVLGLSWNDV